MIKTPGSKKNVSAKIQHATAVVHRPMLPTDFTETSQAESGQSFKPVQGAQGMAFSRRSLAKSVKHTQYLVGGLEPSFFPYIGNKNPI